MLTLSPQTERDLLIALADPDRSTVELLDQYRLTIEQLRAWLESPRIAGQVAAFEAVNQLRARVIAAGFLPAAATRLASIATGAGPRAESERRAASALFRICPLPKPSRAPVQPGESTAPSPAASPSDLSSLAPAPPRACKTAPRPLPTPSPALQMMRSAGAAGAADHSLPDPGLLGPAIPQGSAGPAMAPHFALSA